MTSTLAHLLPLEALGEGRKRAALFFTTFFFTSLATYMAIVFIPLYALKLTDSLSLISLLTTAYYLAFTTSLPLYGRLSDRIGTYFAFTAIGAAATGITCMLIPTVGRIEQLMVLRAAQGVSWALVAPMGAAMASMSTTKALRGRAMGVFNLSVSSGYLAGSIVGGAVSELYGLEAVFLLGGVSAILAAFMALGLRGWKTPRPRRIKRKVELRKVKVVYVGFALRNIGATGIWALLPIYLASLGASDLWVGLLYMVNLASQTALMGCVGNLTDKAGRKPVFLIGLFGSSLVFMFYGLAQNHLWIIPIHILLGLSWCSLITASTSYIGDESPEDAHGAMMSLLFTVTGLSWIIGSSLAAATVSFVGLRNYMFIAAGLSAIGGLYSAFKMQETLAKNP